LLWLLAFCEESLLIGKELSACLLFLFEDVDFLLDKSQSILDGTFRIQHFRLLGILNNP
jgi:hypothetical protein